MIRVERFRILVLAGFAAITLGCRPESAAKHSDGAQVDIVSAIPGYTLQSAFMGNFTNSGLNEFVAFYRNKKNSSEYIDRISVITTRNNRVEKVYPLIYSNLLNNGKQADLGGAIPLNEFAMKFVGRSNFGKWNGYCEIADSNGNGLDEILFFQLTGFTLYPFIFEFFGGQMKQILSPPLIGIVTRIEATSGSGKYFLTVYGPGNPKNNQEEHWFKYEWNRIEGMYLLIEKGTSKDPIIWGKG